jgi:hypothetical protein
VEVGPQSLIDENAGPSLPEGIVPGLLLRIGTKHESFLVDEYHRPTLRTIGSRQAQYRLGPWMVEGNEEDLVGTDQRHRVLAEA